MKKNDHQAFTLIEVSIAVAIVSLLASLAIPNFLKSKILANDAITKSSLKSIGTSLENYMSIYGNYPSSTNDLVQVTPPYLNKNYFVGTHAGFTYGSNLNAYSYTVTATPLEVGKTGSKTYTLTTGSVLSPDE